MKKFIIFFLIFSSFYILIHIYVADFISRFYGDRNKLRLILLLLCLFSVASFLMRRYFNYNFVSYIYLVSFVWMGYIFLTSFIFLFYDIIVKLLNIDFSKGFLISIFTSILFMFFSVINSFKFPNVREIVFYSERANRDYVFYYLSDIHLDFFYKNKIFKKFFSYLNSTDAEFIIIGGDLFDPGFKYEDYMSGISSKPVYFVRGNHEYYYGIDRVVNHLKSMGFDDITNKSFVYEGLNIIAIDDIRTNNFSDDDVIKFIRNHYKDQFVNIILSHQPIYFNKISSQYEIIMFSGHTHCGQIFPFHIFTKIFYPYFCGKYENNGSYIYVSSGAGTWGPPMRFLSSSEILKVIIKKK